MDLKQRNQFLAVETYFQRYYLGLSKKEYLSLCSKRIHLFD